MRPAATTVHNGFSWCGTERDLVLAGEVGTADAVMPGVEPLHVGGSVRVPLVGANVVHGTCDVLRRVAPIMDVLRAAGAQDPSLAGMWQQTPIRASNSRPPPPAAS